VQIVETRSGSVTNTKQFVWCDDVRCEARNASGSITAQYFGYGQTISGANYYYSFDTPGSICELTDASGNVQAGYRYDPWGQVTQLQGTSASDFQYAEYYFHSPSGLSLALYRAYSSKLGRWVSRDPVEEEGGVNLYAYVANAPSNQNDPSGLLIGGPGGGGSGGGGGGGSGKGKHGGDDDHPVPPNRPARPSPNPNKGCPWSCVPPLWLKSFSNCALWCGNHCPRSQVGYCILQCARRFPPPPQQ
jgi:RHS repeat-associated protein